ncbi:MAG: carboxypeptidase-like regulatory domain-containing protein, partial [Flavobacterium sp.]|nr:carboxypeptidase-like regulatory domain-containing protein [Flavobacterium sp.]
MTKIKIAFLFVLFIGVTQAQNVRVEGVVQDTLGKPLEMANVMAINQETKGMDGYGITNDKGRFQLNLKANSKYTIKVSYIGFQAYETTIETNTEDVQRRITLKEGGFALEGVEVVQEMPVSIKGDTIIYNADSFKTGTEQKLEDILKRLPGVDVNADGEIEVEGKRVTQLLVDGKKFFEGDTKLGSKNIPSDAVDKVQVLRNFTEVSQLRGLENNNDDVAINIKLKKGKNKFWFGDISAGAGPDERFIVNPKLFYYSPKTSINVLSNFNNIGDVPFSLRDYFRLTGGSRNTIGRSGTNFNVSSNDLGISTQRNDRAAEIDNKFGAVNVTQQISKTWNVSGFGVLSSNKTLTNTQSRNGIFQPNSTEILTQESRSDLSNVRNNLGIFKFGSKFKPNAAFQFDYDISLRKSSQSEDNNVFSSSITFNPEGNL